MPERLFSQRFLAAVDPQFGDLAGDGVTADTQRLCRFDAATTGMRQRPRNQDALEGLRQHAMNIGDSSPEQAIDAPKSTVSVS